MRNFLVAIPFVIGVLMPWAGVEASPASEKTAQCRPSVRPSKLTGIVRPDNDFTADDAPEGDQVGVPTAVAEKIHALVRDLYRKIEADHEAACHYGIQDLYGPIFRINAPKNRALYAFKRRYMLGIGFYDFILFDPSTGRVTPKPPSIYAKWMKAHDDDLIVKPLVSFDDVDLDGKQEVVVEERVHNGTVYNAIVYHYFRVGQDASLNPILAVETNAIDLLKAQEGWLLVREVRKLGPGQLKLETYSQLGDAASQRAKLGEVILTTAKAGQPFKVAERHAIDPRYEGALITVSSDESNPDENEFLLNGYTFYY